MKTKEPDNNKQNILIVEDSNSQAIELKFMLEQSLYNVVIARNGREALELLQEYKPALIISDIVMPEMNGYELCREIKLRESTKDIPVILLTALSNSEDMFESLVYSADSFISKPFNEKFLLNHIERTLELKGLNNNSISEIDLEVPVGNKIRSIRLNPAKMLTMLISTYEAVITKNNELILAQEKLVTLNDHLEELVDKRTEEISKITAEKEKIFSIIAHDLRSPFQALINLTELMADEEENFNLSELINYSRSLNEVSKNLYELLENLLEWAQMQKGSINFVQQELNLSNLISQNIRIVNERAKQKGITVINEVPESQTIYADEKMIDSVLRNLLTNAVKFTNRDGIVNIKAKNNGNGLLEISVSDTGIGISKDIINKLFKISEKVGSKGTENEPSSGLGLLLCKEFVEEHGGRIKAESEVGKGSIFSFILPMNGKNKNN